VKLIEKEQESKRESRRMDGRDKRNKDKQSGVKWKEDSVKFDIQRGWENGGTCVV
jgi:hypothetical protein